MVLYGVHYQWDHRSSLADDAKSKNVHCYEVVIVRCKALLNHSLGER